MAKLVKIFNIFIALSPFKHFFKRNISIGQKTENLSMATFSDIFLKKKQNKNNTIKTKTFERSSNWFDAFENYFYRS